MSFQNTFEDEPSIMGEINMTPFVDIMLVLLVIFIITVPAIYQAIEINMPKSNLEQKTPSQDALVIAIDAKGNYYLNNTPKSVAELQSYLNTATNKQTPIHIQADKSVAYDKVAQLMVLATKEGFSKILFISEMQY